MSFDEGTVCNEIITPTRRHKRCEYIGCDKINPLFDLPGGKGRFCLTHKSADMIDVKHKRCEHVIVDKPLTYQVVKVVSVLLISLLI